MRIEIVDPLAHPDWNGLLLRSGNHIFFHSAAWAKVLVDSYGYRPIYFAGFNADQLCFLMPLMEVASRITGKRGVSLPFADLCHVFDNESGLLAEAIQKAKEVGKAERWRYIEWRGLAPTVSSAAPSQVFITHDVDLQKTENELFSSLKGSNRTSIRKAKKSGIFIEISKSFDSLKSFYRLHCLTRKRHGLPPQPFNFFKNILDSVIVNDLGILVTAVFSGKAIAAKIFFNFGTRAMFKYGASDMAYQNLRPNNLVMWEAMNQYRERGFESLNLGRTEYRNHGLLHFKRLWGARERPLEYQRYVLKSSSFVAHLDENSWAFSRLFVHMPTIASRLAGRFLYKHVG